MVGESGADVNRAFAKGEDVADAESEGHWEAGEAFAGKRV